MPCLVAIHSAELKVIAANQLNVEHFGDRIGAASWEIYTGASKGKKRCPVGRTVKTGIGQRSREVVRYCDGAEAPVIVHTAPVKNRHGAVELVIEITADVAEVKQLQDHLSALGLKISMISHNIKGLLTGLDGAVYMTDSGFSKENPEKVREGWDAVKLMLTRIRNLVLDILFFAKERDLQWEKVDVLSFVQDIADSVASRTREGGIEFIRDFDPFVGRLKIDPGVIRTAVMNILDNAVDACMLDSSEKIKKIVFAVGQSDQSIFFDISDTGIGMDPETQARLFTLFFSSKGAKGTGLGLYIARNMIEQHGGAITVESVKKKGSRFRISLPRKLLMD